MSFKFRLIFHQFVGFLNLPYFKWLFIGGVCTGVTVDWLQLNWWSILSILKPRRASLGAAGVHPVHYRPSAVKERHYSRACGQEGRARNPEAQTLTRYWIETVSVSKYIKL